MCGTSAGNFRYLAVVGRTGVASLKCSTADAERTDVLYTRHGKNTTPTIQHFNFRISHFVCIVLALRSLCFHYTLNVRTFLLDSKLSIRYFYFVYFFTLRVFVSFLVVELNKDDDEIYLTPMLLH